MADAIPGVLVARSGGAWVYFNADYVRRQILELAGQVQPPLHTVVLDCSMVPAIDFNATSSLVALAQTLTERGAALHLAELRDDVADQLRRRGAEQVLGPISAHRTIEDCMAASADKAN